MRNPANHLRSPRRASRSGPGFTLLEVLVASAMAALIAASLAVSMHLAFVARKTAMAGNETSREARLTMAVLGRDLQAAMRPGGVLAGNFTTVGDDDPDGRGNRAVTFSNVVPPTQVADSAGDVEQITLAVINPGDVGQGPVVPPINPGQMAANAATGSPIVNPPTQMPTVTGDDGVLVRRVVRNLLSPDGQVPDDQVLCRHVRTVAFAFFDGLGWTTDWDSTARNNSLPLAVQVTLEVAISDAAPDASGNRPICRIVRIFPIACGVASTDNSGLGLVGSSSPPTSSTPGSGSKAP